MGKRLVCVLFALQLFLLNSVLPRVHSAEAIREVDLEISALVYDPLTAKLYGAATNHLLQIDPDSGQVLRTFDLGSRIVRLELGAGHGLWAGVSNSVRRFNLETLTAEEPIQMPGEIFDLSPSQSEPYTLALSTPRVVGRWETGWLIKNGLLLPDTVQAHYVAVNGNYFFKDNYRYPIGPNGIINANFVFTPANARMKPFGPYIYAENGAVIHANTIEAAEGSGRIAGRIAINREDNAVYYLTDTAASWDLNRVEHPTARHTGHARFPRHEPLLNHTLAAWSTNRVAFHSSTKLYLVDTTTLFAPSDVAVLQTVPSEVKLGQEYGITVRITNLGPGPALNVTFAHALSSGIIRAFIPELYLFTNSIQTLQPGQSVDLQLRIFPTDVITATNLASVSASNDSYAANNSSAAGIPVVRNTDVVVQIPSTASDIAYDPRHTRLFFTAGGALWMYDPDLAQIRPLTGDRGFHLLDIPDSGGTLWALSGGTTSSRFDSGTLAETPAPGLVAPIHDLATSSANTEISAVSVGSGTFLLNGFFALPNSIPEQGNLAFSADGTRLYFVDASDCTLSVFRADPSAGLLLERKGTNVACGEFFVSGNLLYFQNGAIYDAATGQRATSSLNLTPPAFVVPRIGTYFDLLNRTNGAWVVRRLAAGTLAPVVTVPLDPNIGTPLDFVAMDADTVAIRTSGGPILLVDLTDRTVLRASVSLAANQLTLSFSSNAGVTYRIERSETLANASWTTVRDNIAGSGDRIDEPISSSNAPASFYRVVQL